MKKNSFLILSTALLLLLFSACAIGSTSTLRSENTAATQAVSSQYLGDFQPIAGTNYQLAQISQKPEAAGVGNLVSSLSSREDYGNISNLVFLDAKTLSSHELIAGNDQIILSVRQFPDPENGPGSPALQAQPAQPVQPAPVTQNIVVQWLVYQVIQKKAGEPGILKADLPFSIGVSDAGGNGYQELLSGLTKTYGISQINDQQLLVVYTKNNVKSASILDLAKRSVTATNPLIDLGAGVE